MPIPRAKVCDHCRRAKARCSLARPCCSRCEDRGLACSYPSHEAATAMAVNQSEARLWRTLKPAEKTGAFDGASGVPNQRETNGKNGKPLGSYVVHDHASGNENAGSSNGQQQDGEGSGVAVAVGELDGPPPINDTASSLAWHAVAENAPPGTALANASWAAFPDTMALGPSFGSMGLLAPLGSLSFPSSPSWEASLFPLYGHGSGVGPPLQQQLRLSSPPIHPSLLPPMPQGPFFSSAQPSQARQILYETKLVARRQTPPTASSPDAFLTNKALLGQILAYPRLMISGSRLPPFVHPVCVCRSAGHSQQELLLYHCQPDQPHRCLPEMLAICTSLLQMFYTRTPGSAAFVWEQIYAHHWHMYEQHRNYDSSTLMVALQTTAIYALLQAGDLDTIEKNPTAFLLVTLEEMSQRFFHTFRWDDEGLSSETMSPRQRWVQIESAKRLACILYVTKFLLDIDTRHPDEMACPDSFAVPLPCPRNLWGVASDREWEARFQHYAVLGERRRTQSLFLNLNLGQLIQLRQKRRGRSGHPEEEGAEAGDMYLQAVPGTPFSRGELLNELTYWCENADEFGMLLWMTTMLERRLKR